MVEKFSKSYLKFVKETSTASWYIVSTLTNVLILVLTHEFLNDNGIVNLPISTNVVLSLVLYSARLFVFSAIIGLIVFFYCSQEILESIDFAAIFKIALIGDSANLTGDLVHTGILLSTFDSISNFAVLYRTYPLSLSNLFISDLFTSGILKDLNAFQAIGIVLTGHSIKAIAGVHEDLSLKISILSTLILIITVNLIWSLIFFSFPNAFSQS